jgi:enoyl-CoA hydratase
VTYTQVNFDVDGAIARIALNRPRKLNAITRTMKSELTDALARVKANPDVRVCILRGEGSSFSAGIDLNEVYVDEPDYALTTPIALERRRGFADLLWLRDAIWSLPQPIIAEVQGHCYNVAVAIAMQCDLVYAAVDAKFVVRPLGGAGRYFHMFPWLAGPRAARELLLVGDPVSGLHAAHKGLVNDCFPAETLTHRVEEIAQRIARRSPDLLAIEKRSTNKCLEYAGLIPALEYSMELHAMSHLAPESEEVTDTLAYRGWREAIALRDAKFDG